MVLAFCVLVSSQVRASAETVTVWVYHNFPPFVIDEDARTGMSFDLAEMLTRRSGGRYQFDVVVLPRQRLNDQLAFGAPGIVLWANPLWFGDADRVNYRWSNPLLNDSNDVISPRTDPFTYAGPTSLDGSMLVGVKGHRYPDVDHLVTAGRVERMDVSSEAALVQFIASGRGNIGIVAHSAAVYYVQSYGLKDQVHFAPAPHSTYQRFILVQPKLTDVHAFIQETLPMIAQSEDWRALLDLHEFVGAPTQ